MILLFEDYVCVYGSSSASESGVSQASKLIFETELHLTSKSLSLLKARFKKHK